MKPRSSQKPWGYMARQGAARQPSRSVPAPKPSPAGAANSGHTALQTAGSAPWLVAACAALVVLPLLRWLGVVNWAWALVLAPFTAIGAACLVGVTAFLHREQLAAMRTRVFGASAGTVGATPPPDRLEPPQAAVEAGDGILAEG